MRSLDDVHVQVQQQQAAARRRKTRAMSASWSPVKSPRRRLRSKELEDVGAPAVWIAPDWATHPVIECFYGHARRARASSFYEVMCSPMNASATTTLAESCCGYADAKAASGDEDEGRQLAAVTVTSRTRRPFGSFAYSCTTDTSEEAAGGEGLELGADSPLYDRHATMGVSADNNNSSSNACGGSGFAQWNRMRRTMSLGGGLVPVPPDHHFPSGASSMLENPQSGGELGLSPAASSSDLDSLDRPHSPPTSSRLRAKLLESLRDMNERIAEEHERLNQARRVTKKTTVKPPAGSANVMWSLLCGARTGEASQADGLTFLTEKLGVAVSHRALNQLQRHRRHVRGILQIVTAHNPDLELTERQLDSFEAAEAMLANDIKYSVLHQQHALLSKSAAQRRRALAQAKLHNGNDCFEKPHVKSVMLSKLLEAVSWYRLVQRNAREESASSSVGAVSAPPSAASSAPSSGGLQELQVEKILDVLAGEEFYSDFNELMCQPDWWEIAQAHFENLIFSSKNSRICQWVLQLSKDVAAVSYEELEENESGGLRSRTGSQAGGNGNQKHASWTKDPPPEQILDFLERLTVRVRREFDVPSDVSKSLHVFVQRTVFPRIAVLCFNQRATRDCQRKDKLWRKKCADLSGLPMENLGVAPDLVAKIRSKLPSYRVRSHGSGSNSPSQRRVFLVRAIEAFNSMESVVPCDLLDKLMHGVVILHHEAALVLGTTQFSVETFFPLLAYVLVHCRLPTIHAQLHLLENFAITADNANGEESYYVYCVHAAVEYVCNTAGLGTTPNPAGTMSSTSSAVSTPGGSALSSVMPMGSASPPKNHTAFTFEAELEAELEVKVAGATGAPDETGMSATDPPPGSRQRT
ncbi:hypothetical protein PF002_g4091 [Phytophthora fragariae]|uniref:VPS9 domain-containing protein n=1 Tax=Phytophthora fragariae TaxID=53985 RepID=A0A6A4A8I2_9STRA|nr:hypothetical protein PF002_g4091 [Phytophthora fragariae]